MNCFPSDRLRQNLIKNIITLFFLCFYIIIVGIYNCYASNETNILRYGTWGLSEFPDPFKNSYPAVVYLPAGTIIFKDVESSLPGYKKVQTHYGHWVHIKETLNSENIMVPINKFGISLPSDSIILHESILCLGQSNRIVLPPNKCKKRKDGRQIAPIGKGWIFTLSESKEKPNWVELTVKLDDKTRKQIQDENLIPAEANFDITKDELEELEKQGYLTLLTRKHPLYEFEYLTKKPIYIQCGQEKVTKSTIDESKTVKVKTEAGYETAWTKLITGLTAAFRLEAEADITKREEETYSITVDTTRASYLVYGATMKNTKTNKDSNIIIKKKFECTGSPDNSPGDRILKVTFEIEYPDEPESISYEFTDPANYLSCPDEIYKYHGRPIFISVNTPEQHAAVLRQIMEKWGVNVSLAHFMLANLNNSCPGRNRDKCVKLFTQNPE